MWPKFKISPWNNGASGGYERHKCDDEGTVIFSSASRSAVATDLLLHLKGEIRELCASRLCLFRGRLPSRSIVLVQLRRRLFRAIGQKLERLALCGSETVGDAEISCIVEKCTGGGQASMVVLSVNEMKIVRKLAASKFGKNIIKTSLSLLNVFRLNIIRGNKETETHANRK
ncbi:hypothetical protein L1987_47189 [Smallanthus sonchifolius]|uniref:Uncharacterized protein n=1 Tax=Smallanthus sonchifolius TaxID=185202 RepID=A0ACB9G1I9_9ASTR|nr:hypothetical protein L1987_47189 [Smallanthus sonchifolius]